jgi:hypothetical protein
MAQSILGVQANSNRGVIGRLRVNACRNVAGRRLTRRVGSRNLIRLHLEHPSPCISDGPRRGPAKWRLSPCGEGFPPGGRAALVRRTHGVLWRIVVAYGAGAVEYTVWRRREQLELLRLCRRMPCRSLCAFSRSHTLGQARLGETFAGISSAAWPSPISTTMQAADIARTPDAPIHLRIGRPLFAVFLDQHPPEGRRPWTDPSRTALTICIERPSKQRRSSCPLGCFPPCCSAPFPSNGVGEVGRRIKGVYMWSLAQCFVSPLLIFGVKASNVWVFPILDNSVAGVINSNGPRAPRKDGSWALLLSLFSLSVGFKGTQQQFEGERERSSKEPCRGWVE